MDELSAWVGGFCTTFWCGYDWWWWLFLYWSELQDEYLHSVAKFIKHLHAVSGLHQMLID